MSTELLTTAEAADRLGLTIRAVQKMIEAGRLEARKVGRDYLIAPNALESITKQAAGRPPKKSSPAAQNAATGRADAGDDGATKRKGKK
jgi:excisionase family DNA binding protein